MAAVADNSVSDARNHPGDKRGVIGGTFRLLFRLIGVVMFSTLISICVEWVGMAFFYEGEGYSHAQGLFQSEIKYLNSGIVAGAHQAEAHLMALDWVSNSVNFIFHDSGIIQWIASTHTVQPGDNRLALFLKTLNTAIYDYLIAAVFIIMMVIVRVAILILSSPVFVLFAIVGLVDGLMLRDIRKFTGGHESSFVYHLSKSAVMPFLIFGWVLYLALPISVHPNWIVLPFGLFFGLAILVTASKFKKYL